MAFQEFDGELDNSPSSFKAFDGELDASDTPQTSLWDDFKIGMAGLGNMADKGLTLAATTIAPKSQEDEMFRNMEDRIKSREQFAQEALQGKQQGFGGKVASTVLTLPSQVVAAPMSAIDTATRMVKNGDSIESAYQAAGVDAAFTAAGFALPAGFGKTLLQKALTGGGAGAIQDWLSKYVISNNIAETDKSKQEFTPTLEDAAIAGIVGGGFGAMHRSAPKGDITARPNIEPTSFREFDGQLDMFPNEAGNATPYNPNRLSSEVVEPVGQMNPRLNRELQLDNPEAITIDSNGVPVRIGDPGMEAGRRAFEESRPVDQRQMDMFANEPMQPRPEVDAPPTRDLLSLADESGVPKSADDIAPPIDFPLRTEVLDADPKVQSMREMIAQMEADPERTPEVQASLDYVKEQFGKYMDQAYAIAKAEDAYTPLYEGGKGETRLPIKSTFNPKSGKFGRQGGAIKPKEIREGINILKERFSKAGVGGRVSKILAQSNVKPEPKPTIYNDTARALLDSAAGKGLSDFTMMDLKPENVIEAAKSFDDIKRVPIQEHIEAGGLFRTLATKNPVVKFTTERLQRAEQHATRIIQDVLLNKDTGLRTAMRRLNPVEKGDIWSLQMLAEGNKVFTPEELISRGFTQKQIDYYNKYREIDDKFYADFNAERERLGLQPMDKRTAHIAGRFAGDFYSIAERVKFDKDGNPVLRPDGSFEKEIIGRIGGRNKWEHKRAVEFMKQKHPDWQIGETKYHKMGTGNTAGARFNGFMEAVNLIGKEDGNVAELVEAYRELLKADATKYLNAGRHAKAKKAQAGGIQGSEGNKEWLDMQNNAQDGMKAQLDYFEQGYQWMEMQKASEDIKEVLGNQEVMDRMPNAVGWASMHLDHVMGRNGGFLANATNEMVSALGKASGMGHTSLLKGANNVKHLMMQKFMGFMNIPFTVAQLVQPLQAVPSMALLMKNRGYEFSGMMAGAEATSTMMKLGFHNAFGKDAKLTPVEKQALEYAEQTGIFDVKMMDHTRDINESKVKEAFDTVADFNIKYSELATRGSAFMFYVHALKDTGMPMKDILGTAENMTRMSMVDYTPNARPLMYDKMGFIGDMASTLARYKHGQVNNLMAYGREIGKGKGGVSSLAPMASFIAAQIAFGGLMGVVGYSTADWLVRQISTNFFKDPTSLTDIIMSTKDIPEWISHGVFSAAGVDMSSRFSNAKVVPESVGEFLLPYGTGLWEMVEAGYGFGKNPNEFNAKRLGLATAPSSMRGALENAFFTKKNPQTGLNDVMNPRTMEGNYSRTDKEVALRSFGFRSMDESRIGTKLFEQKYGKDQPREELRKGLMDRVVSDMLSNDMNKEKFSKAFKEYTRLGSDKFDRDLVQRLKAMQLTPEQRYLMRNLSSNYAGAYRLKQYLDEGYNK